MKIATDVNHNKFYPGLYLNEECNICRLGQIIKNIDLIPVKNQLNQLP